MKNVLGIVFASSQDHTMSSLTNQRCTGSIPIGGRYRLIDFALSSLVHSGVEDVGVITKNNCPSLMDHLRNGREWDLSRKKGGLAILPPLNSIYRGKIEALHSAMDYISSRDAQYIITVDCDMMMNTTFDKMFASHTRRGADITVMYKKMDLAQCAGSDAFVLLTEQDGRLREVLANPPLAGEQNVYLGVIIISKGLLEYLVGNCYSRNLFDLERDVLQAGIEQYHINAFEYTGYLSCLSSLQTYYNANLALLDTQVRRDLFPRDLPVYTKVRDDAPVCYGLSSKVTNSLVADGCLIEGEVEGSVLFKGVTVGKGAKVKNSIVMQGTTIGENSSLDCVITDKNVMIQEGRVLAGFSTYPVYISKGAIV